MAYLLLGQHDRAKIHSERAIALNPNDVSAIFEHGFVLTYRGDAVGGLEWFRKAHRLDPYEPESGLEDWLEAYYMSRQYEKAIETFRPGLGMSQVDPKRKLMALDPERKNALPEAKTSSAK